MRAHATVLFVGLAGLLTLHVAAHALEPPTVSLSELGAHEGARVRVEALVKLVATWVRGTVVTLSDDSARVDAFAPAGAVVGRGDTVAGVGVVLRQKGAFTLSIESLVVLAEAGVHPASPTP